MPIPSDAPDPATPTILIVGASRGLGQAMAAEFLRHGWRVIGTVRAGSGRTPLHELLDAAEGRLEIQTVDITRPDQVTALRARLKGRSLDIVFVNAGTTTCDEHVRIGEVTTEEFAHVMLTNALSPMRVVEQFQSLVPVCGLIGVMSSGQGSVANNITGMREVYRASKAALNQLMRSFAARPENAGRALALMAPGWVKTELGGPDAPLTIGESVPSLVEVLLRERRTPGLRYLDYLGRTVSW
jgi:NAD(P)-dependent dehydrogenase (short-subunit alcohol dehydrogenase family)